MALCFGFAWGLESDDGRGMALGEGLGSGGHAGGGLGGEPNCGEVPKAFAVVGTLSEDGRFRAGWFVSEWRTAGVRDRKAACQDGLRLAALVARRGNKEGRNPSGFRPLVVGAVRLAARREFRGGARRAYPRPQSSSA